MMKIPFNRSVCIPEQETVILEVIRSGDTSGNGIFGKKCEKVVEDLSGVNSRMVSSGSHALEMMALLLDFRPGDEIILPSFTFSSTANAFSLRGAHLRFADNDEFGNIRLDEIKRLTGPKTKAVMAVHYAGASADMDLVAEFCHARGISLLEDAAQAIGANYRGRPLGAIGELGCYSFHETKNISAGEGGAVLFGDKKHLGRAEILREKGTNRSAFFQGLVDKYSWVDVGSSYILSELNAAYLYPQLIGFQAIQARRRQIWNNYKNSLSSYLGGAGARILETPAYNTPNYHMFALIFAEGAQRNAFIAWMKERGVICPFHYVPLHTAAFGRTYYQGEPEALPQAERISQCLVRLPIFYNLTDEEQSYVIGQAVDFLRLA